MRMYPPLLVLLLSMTALAHENTQAPHLWSTFKDLDKSVAACRIQARFDFGGLGIEHVVENTRGVYGTYVINGNDRTDGLNVRNQSIRVVAKCTAQGNKSQLWIMVAGHDKDAVELIRNKLAKEII